DVVDAEVGARAALPGLHVRDRGALLVGEPGHVVLGRARVRLELPAEERAPELTRLLGVVSGDLDVHDLAGHLGPPLSSSCDVNPTDGPTARNSSTSAARLMTRPVSASRRPGWIPRWFSNF